jgi:Matrixin
MTVPMSPRSRQNPRSLVALVLVLAGTFLWVRTHATRRADAPHASGCAGSAPAEACTDAADPRTPTDGVMPSAPVIDAAEACRDVGYLCAELATGDTVFVRRWKGFTGTMVVHVPAPGFEDAGAARRLQDAAADGIRAWNGQPFPILIDRSGSRPAQFEVTWRPTLGQSRLGIAHTQWSPATGLRVVSLELSTRDPFGPSRVLDPLQVRLTAAHEMGHALGLPHSDEERDVMYPTNTATALTARDYRALEALYALEDGTRIVR